jgi:hypothetical protein
MAARHVTVLILIGLAAAGCNTPKPDYAVVKMPSSYRTDAAGTIIDNEDYRLDAEGYRLDKRDRQIGLIDVPAKSNNDTSNPLAGYYISSTGAKAPGAVMSPSEGGASGSYPMPAGTAPIPTPMPAMPTTPLR